MSYSQPIVGGNVLLRQEIRSENYVQGVSGWRITRDGDAEFNNIVARGDITASSLNVVTGQGIIRIEDSVDNIIQLIPTSPATILSGLLGTTSTANNATIFLRSPMPVGYVGLFPTLELRASAITNRATMDTGAVGITMDRLRPFPNALGNNAGRTVTSTVFTSALGADTLSVTIPPAESDFITVGLWAQTDVTANNAFISFETRVINAAGAQITAPNDADGIILSPTVRHTYYYEFPITNASFSNSNLFVRMMARTSAGDTLTIQRAKLWARCEP